MTSPNVNFNLATGYLSTTDTPSVTIDGNTWTSLETIKKWVTALQALAPSSVPEIKGIALAEGILTITLTDGSSVRFTGTVAAAPAALPALSQALALPALAI